MEAILKCLFLTVFIGYGQASVLPVSKCKLTDSECMKAEFQNAVPVFMEGIPELGIDVLDPMELDEIAFDLAGLQFTMADGRFRGLKNSMVDKVKWDLDKQRIEMIFHLNGTVKGHYTAAGRLLILPISGDGQMKLKLRNLAVKMYIDYKIVKNDDGKDYVKPIKNNFDFEVKDNAHFNLTNLFNGNQELSNTMHTFVNENWRQVSQEFGRPMMEAAAKQLFKNIAQFFSKQPIDDIVES